MSQEILTVIITGVFSAIGGLFLGRYGLMRNWSSLIDSKIQQANTQSQIALTRENTDLESTRSLHTSVTSLIDLLRQQLVQQAQATVQNAEIEGNKVTAQNNLTSAIREVIEAIHNNQRNIDTILRANRTDIDDFKTTILRHVNTLEGGFRTISDGFIYQSSQLTRVLDKMNDSIDAINAIVVRIHSETVTTRKIYEYGQENHEEVIDLVTDMRNMVVNLTQEKAVAQKMLIRHYKGNRRWVSLNEWLNTLPEWSDNQPSAAATQPIPELQGLATGDKTPQVPVDEPMTTETVEPINKEQKNETDSP